MPGKDMSYYRLVQQSGESSVRRRGRPRGKPRPLNAVERRERNAELERERRDTLADAFGCLRAALGGDRTLTRAETLCAARDYIGRGRGPDVAELRRQNRCLQEQIAMLEARLGVTPEKDPEFEEFEVSQPAHQTHDEPETFNNSHADGLPSSNSSPSLDNITPSSDYDSDHETTDIFPGIKLEQLEMEYEALLNICPGNNEQDCKLFAYHDSNVLESVTPVTTEFYNGTTGQTMKTDIHYDTLQATDYVNAESHCKSDMFVKLTQNPLVNNLHMDAMPAQEVPKYNVLSYNDGQFVPTPNPFLTSATYYNKDHSTARNISKVTFNDPFVLYGSTKEGDVFCRAATTGTYYDKSQTKYDSSTSPESLYQSHHHYSEGMLTPFSEPSPPLFPDALMEDDVILS